MVAPRRIAILGVTGSIGQSAIEVMRAHPDRFQVVLASAHTGSDALEALRSEMHIPHTVITSADDGKKRLLGLVRSLDYDILLNAVAGSAGLEYTFAAIECGRDVALANKESLVLAGHLVAPLQRQTGASLLPVDSEHSAIMQALGNTPADQVRRLILTASGGPFRELPFNDFEGITVAQTLAHPTWDMGAKITVDSATMMNKALEVIEAHWLFGVGFDRIDAVIHPQSVVHSVVETVDGSMLAQMGVPSMRLPILYALGWPHRVPSTAVQTSLLDLPPLTFAPLERDRYPLFFTAIEAGRQGGLLPTVANAANEAAIRLFLDGRIRFIDIARLVEVVLRRSDNEPQPSLEMIVDTNKEVFARVMADYALLLA
ncbi:MAG: 1-deoxy-D-xylulose-5-phosphate reductoisomerase [Candidatus Cloacimonetes bacterium]|nr:1-deoxy-D-xylulose-5-phosphate reductoisomerase [Candidatus Cloacimonadota bacterium]